MFTLSRMNEVEPLEISTPARKEGKRGGGGERGGREREGERERERKRESERERERESL